MHTFRLRTKIGFFVAAILCTIGFVVWPGCATPSFTSSRTPVSNLRASDFSSVPRNHPTRTELVVRLGEPTEYYADLHVACYKLNRVLRHRLVLLFGILPIAGYDEYDFTEVAFIQFDDHDQAQRLKIKIIENDNSYPNEFRTSAQAWATKMDHSTSKR